MWKRYLLIALAMAFEIRSAHGFHKPKIGKTLNVYAKSNFWATSMRMIPANSRLSESTTEAFNNIENKTELLSRSLTVHDYSIRFCDNKDDLLAGYFSDYSVQGPIEPSRIFFHDWEDIEIARMLGIDTKYLNDNYKYILVKITKEHKSDKITVPRQKLTLNESLTNDLISIKDCNDPFVTTFITKYGTHYINSYVTGDFIYQVLVYDEANYTTVQEIRKKVVGIEDSSKLDYLSPSYAVQNGKILSASGNKTLDDWLKVATQEVLPGSNSYPNIMLFSSNSEMMETLSESLNNVVVLKLDLILLPHVVAERQKRICLMRAIDDRFEYLL